MNKMMTLLASVMLLASACTGKQASEKTASGLEPANFRTEVDGKQTDLFVLENKNGMEVCITNFGGRIVSVMVPDKDGVMRDVVLGFDSIQDYIKFPSDFGATIGRYANRINQGKITVDGVEYQLPRNNYGHCLHGGPKGYQYQVFDARQLSNQVLELTYLSKDGEEGFPGNLTCKVTFSLTDDDAIDIRYSAETDRTTVVNMTNHSYFNLDGDPSKSNSDYLLTIDADAYTPVDSTFMTTGEIVSVEGTDMDFRTPTAVGARIDNDFKHFELTSIELVEPDNVFSFKQHRGDLPKIGIAQEVALTIHAVIDCDQQRKHRCKQQCPQRQAQRGKQTAAQKAQSFFHLPSSLKPSVNRARVGK